MGVDSDQFQREGLKRVRFNLSRILFVCYLAALYGRRERLGQKPHWISLIRIILVSDSSGFSRRFPSEIYLLEYLLSEAIRQHTGDLLFSFLWFATGPILQRKKEKEYLDHWSLLREIILGVFIVRFRLQISLWL